MQGMRYANMLKQANMRYIIRNADSTEIKGFFMKNGLIKPVFGGIVDILYEGFRNAFVNCKFTFYNILSSYYKKLKISKTRKSHSKM